MNMVMNTPLLHTPTKIKSDLFSVEEGDSKICS